MSKWSKTHKKIDEKEFIWNENGMAKIENPFRVKMKFREFNKIGRTRPEIQQFWLEYKMELLKNKERYEKRKDNEL